jgi:hypothetical protein
VLIFAARRLLSKFISFKIIKTTKVRNIMKILQLCGFFLAKEVFELKHDGEENGLELGAVI